MKSIDLTTLTVTKAHEAMLAGDFTAVELAQAYLDQIAKLDGGAKGTGASAGIHAYLEVFTDTLDQARVADERFNQEKKGGLKTSLLNGIPCAVKDNILIQGHIASCASKMLEHYTATYDATAIKRLREHGVVFIGRTNMDEFAMGGSTENSAFGTTRNPHDLERVPGGTSGGSAAAIVGQMALISLGSDTGGSIRQPSSFCGVVGLKPTYGAVSRHGLTAAVSSLDQIGPITRTVADAEILFGAIRGKDVMDGTTIDATTYPEISKKSDGKLTVGIPRKFMQLGGISPEVTRVFAEAEERFRALGYNIVDIDLPNNQYALPVYYIINFAEVSSNLSRFDGVRYGFHADGKTGIEDYFETRAAGFGREARRRILLGTYVLSSGYYDAYYNRANALRRLITEDFISAFKKCDIIMTPTAPTPAFKIGEKISDPVAMYLEDIFTVTANLTGLPAMSIPAGVTSEAFAQKASATGARLPIGVQLTAPHGAEASLFHSGKAFLGEK
jgi:aspartyl-tRNA(Asn)/glutamyl-tRNA(Gln) amidotransferase subunit A